MPIDLSLEKSKDIDEDIIEMWRTNDSRMYDSNYRSECVLLKDLKKSSLKHFFFEFKVKKKWWLICFGYTLFSFMMKLVKFTLAII